jgi:hypothetical protein
MCGPAVPSRPVHSPHGLSSSPASAGISSPLVRSRSFVAPIGRHSIIGQQRDVLILVLPIRTKGHGGGARGFVISESKIVGDCDKQRQLSPNCFAHDDEGARSFVDNFGTRTPLCRF